MMTNELLNDLYGKLKKDVFVLNHDTIAFTSAYTDVVLNGIGDDIVVGNVFKHDTYSNDVKYVIGDIEGEVNLLWKSTQLDYTVKIQLDVLTKINGMHENYATWCSLTNLPIIKHYTGENDYIPTSKWFKNLSVILTSYMLNVFRDNISANKIHAMIEDWMDERTLNSL